MKRLLIAAILVPMYAKAAGFYCVTGDAVVFKNDSTGTATKMLYRELQSNQIDSSKMDEMLESHLIYRIPANTTACQFNSRPDKTMDVEYHGQLLLIPGIPQPVWVDSKDIKKENGE